MLQTHARTHIYKGTLVHAKVPPSKDQPPENTHTTPPLPLPLWGQHANATHTLQTILLDEFLA